MRITKEHYEAAVANKKIADETITAYFKQSAEDFKARLERYNKGEAFTDEELIYSAGSRCPCGCGHAYPKECGVGHYWTCAGVLLRTADKEVAHDLKLPFAFYEIKSEQQPSACGATTRPQ